MACLSLAGVPGQLLNTTTVSGPDREYAHAIAALASLAFVRRNSEQDTSVRVARLEWRRHCQALLMYLSREADTSVHLVDIRHKQAIAINHF